jgi:general secretion pathway protein G
MSNFLKNKGFTHTPNFGVTPKGGGFTLIELLVVVAIISLLSSVVLASLNTARAKARDTRRLSDMRQIQNALELYYDKYGAYPGNVDNDNGGWDTGCFGVGDSFISSLEIDGFISKTPCDPSFSSQNGGYSYYRYSAGYSGCSVLQGAFFILGIRDVEGISGTHPSSPGFSCPARNWQAEFEWVTGKFEQ